MLREITGKGTGIRKCYGKGNLRLIIPGNPGNHIKIKILFIFIPWPGIRKMQIMNIISRPNSRPKLPLPKNGKGNYKMPREGTGNLRLVFPGITGNRISRSPLPLSHATSPILQCHIFLPPYPTHGHGGHIHVLDLKFKIFWTNF